MDTQSSRTSIWLVHTRSTQTIMYLVTEKIYPQGQKSNHQTK